MKKSISSIISNLQVIYVLQIFLCFIGKTGLLDQRNKGITKRLVQFHLEAFDSELEMWPGGGEAIHRNGEYVG